MSSFGLFFSGKWLAKLFDLRDGGTVHAGLPERQTVPYSAIHSMRCKGCVFFAFRRIKSDAPWIKNLPFLLSMTRITATVCIACGSIQLPPCMAVSDTRLCDWRNDRQTLGAHKACQMRKWSIQIASDFPSCLKFSEGFCKNPLKYNPLLMHSTIRRERHPRPHHEGTAFQAIARG